MVKRSLQASVSGIEQAKRAFDARNCTQESLATEVGLKTRQSIWRFFTGQSIERQVFLAICSVLDLEWRDIAIVPPTDLIEPNKSENTTAADIDALVRQVRSQHQDKIYDQCGSLQLLEISRPIKIDDIYIDVTTVEEIPSQQWLALADLQVSPPQEVDQLDLETVSQSPIAGIKAVEIYSKLRVLGKPGAGKTTFLQHLAIRCIQNRFAANRVPVFVALRDFADESRTTGEFSLLSYIYEDFLTSGITDPSTIKTLLREGKVLLLLDGVDEVLEQERRVVVKEIRRLSEKYQKNLFVVTCRTGARALNFGRFTDVEMAPLTQDQIAAFAQKWFTRLTRNPLRVAQQQALQFIEKLNLPENSPIRRLAVTPLFLHLACWVFYHQGDFPAKRSQFYQQCLDLLLSQWDETRGIERDGDNQGFSLPQKLKLLSQLAIVTLEQGDYFFKRRTVEQHIGDYLREQPNVTTEQEELQFESEEILKAIELQHGLLTERVQEVFSFSDQIFQEYFAARRIAAAQDSEAFEQALEQLVVHINNPRWREVFRLTAELLRNADPLLQLMKQRVDAIATTDPELHTYLNCLRQSSSMACNTKYQWNFSPEQQQNLQQYYDASQLLWDCLNSGCEVTPAIRQEIELTLLVPQKQ